MTKRELTTIRIGRETRPTQTEQWDLMPTGTTFIHPEDKHLCLKVSDEIMFDFEEKVAIDVKETQGVIWDFGREDPIDFELVDITIVVKEK